MVTKLEVTGPNLQKAPKSNEVSCIVYLSRIKLLIKKNVVIHNLEAHFCNIKKEAQKDIATQFGCRITKTKTISYNIFS